MNESQRLSGELLFLQTDLVELFPGSRGRSDSECLFKSQDNEEIPTVVLPALGEMKNVEKWHPVRFVELHCS